MLTPVAPRRRLNRPGSFVVVASRYNRHYVNAMLRNARRELKAAGIERVRVIRVPGAFEIPVVASRVARESPPPSAILCLGVIFQGETAHARQIGDAVSASLARVQVECLVPVIHGVYLFDTVEQARVRCLGKEHNRGVEIARTALAMAAVMRSLDAAGPDRA